MLPRRLLVRSEQEVALNLSGTLILCFAEKIVSS